MSYEIREEVDSVAYHYRKEMPEEIKTLLTLAKYDLRNGPVYLDSDGDSVSCFDDGAKRFDFAAARQSISGYLENISDITVTQFHTCEECDGIGCEECCEEGCCEYEESISGTREMIIAAIVGNDLASYM